MINDILTVMWKERKEAIGQQKNWGARFVNSVFPVLSLGLFFANHRYSIHNHLVLASLFSYYL